MNLLGRIHTEEMLAANHKSQSIVFCKKYAEENGKYKIHDIIEYKFGIMDKSKRGYILYSEYKPDYRCIRYRIQILNKNNEPCKRNTSYIQINESDIIRHYK